MSLLKDRIQEAFDELPAEKRNQRKLADYCKVKPPSVNGWFSGETQSLKGKSLVRAAEYLEVREQWLATGIGQKSRKFDTNTSPARIGAREIPLLNYIQAGLMTDMGTNFPTEGMEHLQTDLTLSTRAFALQIKGKSMLPDFKEGDRIIVDCEVYPHPGDFVVAKNSSDEATFKKYRLVTIDEAGTEVFELIPLNSDYPTVRSDQQHLQIIGTMVEHRKYFRT